MGSRLRDNVRYLFECFCEVAPGVNEEDPTIIKKYPDSYKSEQELKNVPKFTFPCQMENLFIQHYSFVMTSMDSKYTFCFCRYDPRTNTSLVLLSHLSWHDVFYKLLNCIAGLLNSSESSELYSFLEACRIRPPLPGHTLKVTYSAGQNVFTCQSPDMKLPSIPGNCNLTEYFSAVDTKCMAGLWAALLHERRIAVVATKPSRLSAAVQAANATLYPMSWQHIFIPILPKHLVDYLLAPMPYLIGVPKSVMETVRMSDIGDICILDVDANILKTPFNDLDSLPNEVVSNLKKALSDKNALGDTVSRAFLRALVCLIGSYRDAIRIEKGQLITFSPEAFVRTRKNMQPFLREILESQIFRQFIDERLDILNSGRGFNDEFEMECYNYAEHTSGGSGQRFKQQYRDWAKTMKKEGGAFLKTVKNKANPAVKTAVNTVRQGGRNVKSAVRGLKNRMPKTGSRPSSINTADDSRYSGGSATPVSSGSSDSLPSHGSHQGDHPPPLPLDLLTEMESLFPGDSSQRSATLSHGVQNYQLLSNVERSRTLSPCPPPRLPDRPALSARYPIIPTRRLVDVTDAPVPPPRPNAAPRAHFVSHITKNEPNGLSVFHTPVHFTEVGPDKGKSVLGASLAQRKLSLSPSIAAPKVPLRNGGVLKATQSAPTSSDRQSAKAVEAPAPQRSREPPQLAPRPPRVPPPPAVYVPLNLPEASDSGSDLIQLDISQDDSSLKLEDFDPLKRVSRTASAEQNRGSTDLLHEYGLDFSQFDHWGVGATSDSVDSASQSNVPKGWTTFN